jgi:hypothetical protein
LVGENVTDLLVNELVIVELKAVKTLAEEHEAQLLNYLKATPYEVGLLLNFGPHPQIKGKVFDSPEGQPLLVPITVRSFIRVFRVYPCPK